MEDTTKDYVINLRVSRQTYQKIKDKAKKNGNTISSLLRAVIDDSAEIISDLSQDLSGAPYSSPKNRFSDITAYHRAVLAQARPCDNCRTEMIKGEITTIGETAKGPAYYFCGKCK